MRRFLSIILSLFLAVQQAIPVWAQSTDEVQLASLPSPGEMVRPSDRFDPLMVKGLRVYADNPLKFDFIVDTGMGQASDEQIKPEAARLIKYFLTALTVPDEELWVNLSPFEKDRIIPDNFGITDMGRDLLSQDYLLKQLTASLMYPEEKVGKVFWDRVYARSQQLFGTTDIEVETFNKVWVVPERARIQVSGDVAFVVESRLKVMMEEDYLALEKNALEKQPGEYAAAKQRVEQMQDVSAQMIKDVLIPVIEEEVNNGRHFAPLRQIYHSLILATWFKQNLRDSYLGQVYVGENKVNGIDIAEKEAKQRIYQQYLAAFQTGVYNYVREEYDQGLQETIPRKYFSGGMRFGADIFNDVLAVEEVAPDAALISIGRETRGELRTLATDINPVPVANSEGRRDAAILSESTAVDLGEYIVYRNLYLAGQIQGDDALQALDDPQLFQKLVADGLGDRDPAKIESLITRQAPLQQSIIELVANASDAITGRSTAIGRFGVGALQMLAFVLDEDNPILDTGAHAVVNTRTEGGQARQLQFFKGRDNRIKLNVVNGQKSTSGTKVQIVFPNGIDANTKSRLQGFVVERLSLFNKMAIFLNGQLINPLDDHAYLNGDKVQYDHPESSIRVNITDNVVEVEDVGTGMSDQVLLDKYLIPRRGENQDVDRTQSEEDINREVHLFYKGPQRADQQTTSRIVFQVGGINIQSEEIEGYGLPGELIIQLPSSTQLTVSRDKIEIDQTTHTAVEAIARKIVEGDPIHQVALINGFMRAVQMLDQSNTRVDALPPLVERAKKVFLPFVMRNRGLVLPNDELFRQMEVPSDTIFLDQSLTYRISADQIPGAQDIKGQFRAGRFSSAYIVPFKTGSDVVFLEAGNSLLINRDVYERYKDQPMLLNLRLNFYRGYGTKEKSRGWILPEDTTATVVPETQIIPMLEQFPQLTAALSDKQVQWLDSYFVMRALPTVEEAIEAMASGQRVSIDHFPGKVSVRIFQELTKRGIKPTDVVAPVPDGSYGKVTETSELFARYMVINREIDASDEKVMQLLERLNRLVASVPEYIRERVDWDSLLPFGGESGNYFEALLSNPDNVGQANENFLERNTAFFLNRDHPERLVRYLDNVMISEALDVTILNETTHALLASVDARGLSGIDNELVEAISDTFDEGDLERLEDAFEGINEALPHVTGPAVKRVISRWLRIYNQDSRAAEMFVHRLKKTYASEERGEDQPAAYEIFRGDDLADVKNADFSAITPDGTKTVIAMRNMLFVDDMSTGQQLGSLEDIHDGSTRISSNLVITPDSRAGFSADEIGTIVKWDLETGEKLLEFIGHPGSISLLRLTDDGRFLVSYGKDAKEISMWETETGVKFRTFTDEFGDVKDLTISPDGQSLVVTQGAGKFQVISMATGEYKFGAPAHLGIVRDEVKVLPVTERLTGQPTSTIITPDSEHLIIVTQAVFVYNLASGDLLAHRRGEAQRTDAPTLSPDGRQLAVPLNAPESDSAQQIAVFHFPTLKLQQILQGHDGPVSDLSFAPNGDLFSHGRDGKLKIWDVVDASTTVPNLDPATPRQVVEMNTTDQVRINFGIDESTFLISTSGLRGTGQLRYGRTKPSASYVLELASEDAVGPSRNLGSPDGQHVITMDRDGVIRVTDSVSGEIVNELVGSRYGSDEIKKVMFVEDAIVVLSKTKTMEVYDRNTSALRHSVEGDMLDISADGKYYIASGVNLSVRQTSTDNVYALAQPGQIPTFATAATGNTFLYMVDESSGDTSMFDINARRATFTIPMEVQVNENVQVSATARYMLVPSTMTPDRWDVWDVLENETVISARNVRRAKIVPELDAAIVERSDQPVIEMVDLSEGTSTGKVTTRIPMDVPLGREGSWQITNDGQYLMLPTQEGVYQIFNMLDQNLLFELSDLYDRVMIAPDQKHILAIQTDYQTLSVIDIATGDVVFDWKPFGLDQVTDFQFSDDGRMLLTTTTSGNIRAWTWNQLAEPAIERTGFAALNPRDTLKGIPAMLRTVIRFMRDADVTLLDQEQSLPRDPSWQVSARLNEPVSLALMNALYQNYSRAIQRNPELSFDEFLNMADTMRGVRQTDYVNIIRSAIEGQDKTQRAWVREIAIQNSRDATRRAREQNQLYPGQGDVEIRNFMEGDDWVFQVRDQGTGMSLFDLVRFFFPLDQSSKDYLTDTGNLGQGNYTLFADFDRVFMRTSRGDGVIQELVIENDPALGPVIVSWDQLSGTYKGTEIRRIKNNTKSDPQLESLFIQEALQRFAGAITSPQQRYQRGEKAQVRDVRILYNDDTFAEEIIFTASGQINAEIGEIGLARSDDQFNTRVIQDGIYVKNPDGKELAMVPRWLQAAFERRGGLHIALPRGIKLNIPRTGYSQEHTFLGDLQVAVLHNMMKTVLADYVDYGLKVPGTPADYFDNYGVTEDAEAIALVQDFTAGRYDAITAQRLQPFLNSPTRLFALMAYLPFESDAYTGPMTLHEIRERFVAAANVRSRRQGAIEIETDTQLTQDFVPKGEFALDVEESVGNLEDASIGNLGGRLKQWATAQRQRRRKPSEVWDRLPADTKLFVDYLSRRLLQPIVGEDIPEIGFYNQEDNASARAGVAGIKWNLFYNQEMFAYIMALSQDPNLLAAELQTADESSPLWQFLETLLHEVQHLPQFEEPGDHTHHDESEIEGLDAKDDQRFGVRMGRGIDAVLTGMQENLLTEFSRPAEEMATFVASTADRAGRQTPRDSAVLAQDSQEVGGIDLNPQRMELEVDGGSIPVQTPVTGNLQVVPVEGFYPVIINVIPTNLPLLLGAPADPPEEPNPQLFSALREEDVML